MPGVLFPIVLGFLGSCWVLFPTSFQPWGLLGPCQVLFPTSFQFLGAFWVLAGFSFSNLFLTSWGLLSLCRVFFRPLGAFWALAGCSFQHLFNLLGASRPCQVLFPTSFQPLGALWGPSGPLPSALSNFFPTSWGFLGTCRVVFPTSRGPCWVLFPTSFQHVGLPGLARCSFQSPPNLLGLSGHLQGFLSDLLGPPGPLLGALSNIFPTPWGLPGLARCSFQPLSSLLGPSGHSQGALSCCGGLIGSCWVFFPTSFQPWSLLGPCPVLFPTSFQFLGAFWALAGFYFQPLSNLLGPSGSLQGVLPTS